MAKKDMKKDNRREVKKDNRRENKKESKYFGGETPFIKIPDMHNKTFVINSEDSLTKEGIKYSNRVVAEKTATNNQWIGANHLSTEGTKYSNRHQAEKTATNNQWVSRNMPDEK